MKKFLALTLLVVVSGVSAADSSCPKSQSTLSTYVCNPVKELSTDSFDYLKKHYIAGTLNGAVLAYALYTHGPAVIKALLAFMPKKSS